MSEEAAFLRAIEASPDDDVPRLVFADWLADRDDPRAAWVRDADIWEWMRPDARNPLPALVATLGDRTDWPRMWRARAVLQKLGDRALQAVCDWLREDPTRWPEMGPFSEMLEPLHIEAIQQLQSRVANVVRRAANDLRDLGPDPRSVTALIETHRRWCVDEPGSHAVFAAVFETLGHFGPAADAAVPILASDFTFASYEAGEVLHRIRPDPDRVYQFMHKDDDEEVLWGLTAINAIDPHSPAWLVRLLRTSRDQLSRSAAIEILGEQHDAETIPLLIEIANATEDDHLHAKIVAALVDIDDPEAIPFLENLLARYPEPRPGSNSDIRRCIIDALDTLRPEREP